MLTLINQVINSDSHKICFLFLPVQKLIIGLVGITGMKQRKKYAGENALSFSCEYIKYFTIYIGVIYYFFTNFTGSLPVSVVAQ